MAEEDNFLDDVFMSEERLPEFVNLLAIMYSAYYILWYHASTDLGLLGLVM